MDALKFCLFLFPALGLQDAEVSQEKMVGEEPDETPICTNGTDSIIVLVVCKIRTQSSRECLLRYDEERGFNSTCDSKFSLMTKNQTFLLLTSLTPADGGNHTCECSLSFGTFILHMNISVRADQGEHASVGDAARHNWTIVVVAIMVTVIILGCICRRLKRKPPDSQSNHPNEESEWIEPYSTFIHKENELYANRLT